MSTLLSDVVAEIDQHVTTGGWDQPVRLYALVPTRELLLAEPALAASIDEANLDGWTPVEQEGFDDDRPLDEALATIGWPANVAGCALVVERMVLPADAEAELAAQGLDPSSPAFAERAMDDSRSREVRMTVAVLRDGLMASRLRVRAVEQESDDDVVDGPNLVPGLAAALRTTLHD